MKLKDFVDIEKFKESIKPPSKEIFSRWSFTAFEVCRANYTAIARIRDIYMQIPEEELRQDQVITFIEELLQIMQSIENKKALITAEAIQFRTFEIT